MAFETLSEKFQRIFKRLKGQNNLSESNMEEMLGEIKVALLDADVNYKVVKKFLNEVKEKAIGQQVLLKVNPSQMITKIVHDELVALLGSNKTEIQYNKHKPTVIMLVGLQGTGKTTTAAKLAYLMKNKLNKKVLFAACDIYRPAAVAQLKTLATSLKMDVVHEEGKSAVEIANLDSIVSGLQIATETYEAQIAEYETQIANGNQQIQDYEMEIVALRSQIAELQETIRSLEAVNEALNGNAGSSILFSRLPPSVLGPPLTVRLFLNA